MIQLQSPYKDSDYIITGLLNATQSAAIASYEWIGRNDNVSADRAAVEAMRNAINMMDFDCQVVMGEGERDEAPMLYVGERLGKRTNNIEIDIAVDPLEGTSICAKGLPGSMSVMIAGPRGSILKAPDVYMKKIAVNCKCDGMNIDLPVEENIRILSKELNKKPSEMTAIVLERERHSELINDLLKQGLRVKQISDGDIAATISVYQGDADIYIGSGGAPEGVISAAVAKHMNGFFQGKLLFRNEKEKDKARIMGIANLDFIYNIRDMVNESVVFIASAVTDAINIPGIKIKNGITEISSVIYSRGQKRIVNHRYSQ